MALQDFYVVWSPDSGPPSVKHRDRDTATDEARRLAAVHPGREFFVLAAVSVSRKTDVVTENFGFGEDLPF